MANIEQGQLKFCFCHLRELKIVGGPGVPDLNAKVDCKCPIRIAAKVNIEVNGRPLPTVLDTGAMRTLIDNGAVTNRSSIVKNEPILFATASGPLTAHETAEVKIKLPGAIIAAVKCIPVTFPAHMPIKMILGMDVLAKCDTLRLHFNNGKLSSWEIVNYNPKAKRSDLRMDFDVRINGMRLIDAILDTGSDITLIKKSVIADLIKRKAVPVKSLKDRCICTVAVGANGQPVPIEGIVDLDLSIGGEEFKQTECQVIDVLPCDMIIGMNLLSQFKTIEINFRDNGDETIRFLERRRKPASSASGQQQRTNKKPATTPTKTVPKTSSASSSRGSEAKPNQPKAAAPGGKGSPGKKPASKPSQPRKG